MHWMVEKSTQPIFQWENSNLPDSQGSKHAAKTNHIPMSNSWLEIMSITTLLAHFTDINQKLLREVDICTSSNPKLLRTSSRKKIPEPHLGVQHNLVESLRQFIEKWQGQKHTSQTSTTSKGCNRQTPHHVITINNKPEIKILQHIFPKLHYQVMTS